MGFKIGALVVYNNQNWVILDIQTKQISNGELSFLKIKNILTQEVLNIDSRYVREFKIKQKTQSENIGDVNIHNQSLGDTAYIKSLFDEVGEVNTNEFFDFDEHSSLETNNQNVSNFDRYIPKKDITFSEITDSSETTRLIENFQTPNSQKHFTPRRSFNTYENLNNTPVNETLTDMKNSGIWEEKMASHNSNYFSNPDQNIHVPRRTLNNSNTQETFHNNVENNRKLERARENLFNSGDHNLKEQVSLENISNELLNKNLDKSQNMYDNVKSENIVDMKSSEQNLSQQKQHFIVREQQNNNHSDKTAHISENYREKRMADSNFINKMNENNYETKFEEKLTVNNSSTSDNTVIKSLNKKANLYKEKHFEALETGPLNTKKLLDNFNKQKNIKDALDEKFIQDSNEKSNTLFWNNSNFDKTELNNSKIYRKFKNMSGWLITVFVIFLITPIVGLFMKVANFYINSQEHTISFEILKQIFLFQSNYNDGNLVYFIADVLIIIATPALFLVFITFSLIYWVSVGNKQYKKLAFYNFQLQSKIEVIDSIQEFNNESSLYLIKVHNDMKKIKKEIKNLKAEKKLTKHVNNIEKPYNMTH